MADHTPRPQTHRRDIDGGIGVWESLGSGGWQRTCRAPATPFRSRPEYEQVYWFGGQTQPTVRDVVDHANKIAAADLSHPIILSHTRG